MIIGSTFTDDFEIYSYKENEIIVVIWKLIAKKEMIFEGLKNYSQEIQFVNVLLREIETVKKKILEKIKLSIG